MEIKEEILKIVPLNAKILISYLEKKLPYTSAEIHKNLETLISENKIQKIEVPTCSNCLRTLENKMVDSCMYCGVDFEEDSYSEHHIYTVFKYKKL